MPAFEPDSRAGSVMRISLKHRVALLLACAWCAGAAPVFRAQSTPSPAQRPEVTFQAEVNYVDVDAVVTDQQGNFVRALAKDDFELFEDGKRQKVDIFSAVDIPVERRNSPTFGGRQGSSDVRSNLEAFAGRVYVIVLDDLNTSFTRSIFVRRAARQFIEQNLGANDVASVLYTSSRTDASQEFTSDRRRLLAAVDKFLGRKLRSATLDALDVYYQQEALATTSPTDTSEPGAPANPIKSSALNDPMQGARTLDFEDMERGDRATRVLNELRDLAEYLAGVHGRRKALLFFSEGIDYNVMDAFGARNASDVQVATREAIAAAARSNVSFFAIDPRGLVGMSEEAISMVGAGATDPSLRLNTEGLVDEMRMSQNSLRTLADQTGGFAAVNANNLAPAFARIVQANSTYYVLGYYPPAHPRDGKFHQIEVRVRRPGLHVEARKGYAASRGKTSQEKLTDVRKKVSATTGAPASASVELMEVLDSPMQQSGLTLSVQAAPFRGTANEASVAMAVDIDPARLHFKPAGNNSTYADNLELSFFSVNEEGKPIAGITSVLTLNLRPETYRILQVGGLRANPRAAFAPGRYQLRVAVRESGAGEMGSVFYDLDVPDFSRDPLMMSGVLITSAAQSQVPSAVPDKTISVNDLPAPATSRREFVQGDMLALFAELYDNASASGRQIDVVTRLIAEDGRDAFTARDTLGGGLTPSPSKTTTFVHSKQIGLKDIAPGTYLLRIEATARGTNQPSVSRETVITVFARQ
jgi:VWFA-related protein